MDELAAAGAAATLAMVVLVDSENPEVVVLETTAGTVGAAVGDEADDVSASADEANQPDLPVPRRLQAANPKR